MNEIPLEVLKLLPPMTEHVHPKSARIVTASEMLADLERQSDPTRVTLRSSKRRSPVEDLDKPLDAYVDRVFYYPGLIYSCCLLDDELANRFEADTGYHADTRVHNVSRPLVTVEDFPDFINTRASKLLMSVDMQTSAMFIDFVCSQIIVDKKNRRVWTIKAVPVTVPDPYALHNSGGVMAANLLLFCPALPTGQIVPKAQSSMFPKTPDLYFKPHTEDEARKNIAWAGQYLGQ